MMILSLIPTDVKSLLTQIEELGFVLCLVGGAPRDYLLEKKLSIDLDFEVRNADISILKIFFTKNKIKFSELPYHILRVDFNSYNLEFSPPRLEKPIADNKTHHHFEAVLDKNLSYVAGFKRRDFTINAMGFEFDFKKNVETFIDPYQGANDLKKKILKEISDDFFLDSVRFLRMIRFSIKYDFKIDEDLEARLGEFDLSHLSKHHFISEMMKSLKAGQFLNRFNQLVKKFQLQLPAEFLFFNNVKFSSELTFEDLLITGFKENEGLEISKFLSFPEKKLKDLTSFNESYEFVKGLSKENLKNFSTPLNESSNLEFLKHLKNLENKKEWRPYYEGKLPISWSDWEEVSVTESEINSFPLKVRSFIKYHKALLKVVGLG